MKIVSRGFKVFFYLQIFLWFVSSAAFGQSARSSSPNLTQNEPTSAVKTKGAASIPEGRELVNMDFPELTDIKDIIKAVALWTGKNVILDRNVTGKVQIISPKKVTKEEAYQAFLSALNMLNLTTVETGKVIKVMKVRNAVKGNLKTYLGSSWAPRTDEIITQIIPLKYIDAKQVQTTLSRIVSTNSMIAYEPTNTLIISESGYKVRRVLEILELLDVQTQQPKVLIVPIKYSDPKSIADKVNEILRSSTSSSNKKRTRSAYHSFKILIDERSNSVIIFGPPRTIQDIRALVKKFDIPLDDPTAQASIHVRPLDYADAKKLAGTLSSLTSGSSRGNLRRPPTKRTPRKGAAPGTTSVADLGDGVKITADEASNSLLITGNRSAYDALNSIIRKLDVRRSQVFIEADILDINERNDFNFGTSIFGGFGGANDEGTKAVTAWEAGGMAPLIVSQVQDNPTSSNTQQVAEAFSNNMAIGILSGQTVKVPGLGDFRPGALINLLKSDGNTRVLASPHILTSNNEEAAISVGEKVFFRSSSTNPTTGAAVSKVEKEDIDLSLNIKPNISHSNYVTIDLTLESNSLKGLSDEGLPMVSKRKTKQIVTVKNGQTIVVSGLVENREFESYKKIPLLGDIPILGWLFRNSTTYSQKSNLVIFLTPHIVHGANDLASIYQSKIKERDGFMEDIYGSGYQESDFYKALPRPEDGAYKPTTVDEAEEKLRENQRQGVYKAIGYEGMGSSSEQAPAPVKKDVEATVPIPAGGGDDGGFDGPASPPPPSKASNGLDDSQPGEELNE
ncbi:MAG: type II secretion system secretin GspD [Oligoflexales bacterium]